MQYELRLGAQRALPVCSVCNSFSCMQVVGGSVIARNVQQLFGFCWVPSAARALSVAIEASK